MEGPRGTHEAALAARRQTVAELESRARTIGNARLLVAVLAVVLVGAIAFGNAPKQTWFGVVACVAIFAALVVVHARVHAQKDRAALAMRFHERALAHLYLGKLYVQTGQIPKAVEAWKVYLEMDPNSPNAERLRVLLAQLGYPQK